MRELYRMLVPLIFHGHISIEKLLGEIECDLEVKTSHHEQYLLTNLDVKWYRIYIWDDLIYIEGCDSARKYEFYDFLVINHILRSEHKPILQRMVLEHV